MTGLTARAELSEGDEASEGPWALPDGWCWASLGSVLPISYGKALPERHRTGTGEFPVFGSSGQVGSHHDSIAPSRSILIGRKGSAGSVFYSEGKSWPIDTVYFTNGSTCIDVQYGYWFLHFRNLGRLDQSTAIPSLSRDIYNVQPIPIAPLAEQRRIVARLETLFAEIAEGEAALEEARKGLDAFRRALLRAAVTGELTKDWRAANPAAETGHNLLARIESERATRSPVKARNRRLSDDPPSESLALPKLPKSWAWATLGKVVDEMEYGTSEKCDPVFKGLPVLRMGNLDFGSIDYRRLKYAPIGARVPLLRDGDLVFNRTNSAELVGKSAVYGGEIAPCSLASYLIRIRFHDVPSEFVAAWINSAYGRIWIASHKSQQVGQANVSGGTLKGMAMPIPPREEALEVLRRLSGALAGATDTLAVLEAEAADAAQLKQSILKAAFEGRLVPQDPADEPASALLARLKASQPASVPRGRGRARKTHS